jgi:hypothetical protein
MAQPAVLSAPSIHAGFDEAFPTPIHTRYVASRSALSAAIAIANKNTPHPEETTWGASSLPTPPPETGIELPADIPGIDFDAPFVAIEGLAPLASCPPADLMRLRILQAALQIEANGDDAERAFFVADLSKIYEQFVRWQRCLPNIEPFYGT